jgi:hypothetical protein
MANIHEENQTDVVRPAMVPIISASQDNQPYSTNQSEEGGEDPEKLF